LKVRNNYAKLFFKGFLLNFINIGVLAFWLGIVLLVGPSVDMEKNAIFIYFIIILTTYFSIDLVKIFLAKQLKNKLTPTLIYQVKKTMGVILIVCGFFLIIKGFVPNEDINQLINLF
jgi:threonine/homoserine/homoserine lactone efflux protein